MSAVVGVDLSSFVIDLVKLEEQRNAAEWRRCELPPARKGSEAPAWERLLSAPETLPDGAWWEGVYLVAIEAPYGASQRTLVALNRVAGALVACLPFRLRAPERCWIVRPDEWKHGLGLKGKPTLADIDRITGVGGWTIEGPPDLYADMNEAQNSRDAYCLALWAREANRAAVAGDEAAREKQLVLV